MAENTNIEWCDHTFNPWVGCTQVSPGCENCYAEAMMDMRLHRVKWGAGQPRQRTSPANWREPLRWQASAERFQAEHGRRQRVFCASLADVFDNAVDPQWRADLFALIRSTPNLDWLLLTKRIGNAHEMMVDAIEHELDMGADHAFDVAPWPNVWLGATIVNQAEADRDIPKLLAIDAAKRFLSLEPLLGPVDLPQAKAFGLHGFGLHAPGIDWVIAGGESGPKARPIHPDWARSLRDQCQTAGVPFLFKQWGEWAPRELWSFHAKRQCAIKLDGSQVSHDEAPQDVGGHRFEMVGKKAAGRQLDGREWNEFPA